MDQTQAHASSIRFINVSYQYPGTKSAILKNIDLSCASNKVLAILGPSGCGKSTLLKMAAGLLSPSEGRVVIEDNTSTGLALQNPTLLPWLDVIANITHMEKLGKKTKIDTTLVEGLLKHFGIYDKLHSRPAQLSGGQQSRVSLVRALAQSPQLLLLDEPFSMLDEITVEAIIPKLSSVLREMNTTTLFISHNVAQAVFLADEVIVLGGTPTKMKGKVQIKLPAERTNDMLGSAQLTDAISAVRKLLKKGNDEL